MNGSPPSPSTVDGLFNAILDVYEQGDAPRALLMLQDLLRRNQNHPGALFMAGSLSLEAGRPAEALGLLEAAVRLLPQQGEPLHVLGTAYFVLGRWTEAVDAYRAARQAGRKAPDLLNNLGLALKELGDVEGAVLAYREALELSPADAGIYNNLGTALNRLHDHPGAIAVYKRALELEPGNADVWANLATICEHANMDEEAEAAVAHGLAVAPQHENLHLMASRCKRRRGDPQGATAELERRLSAAPPVSPGICRVMEYELGRCYDMLGDARRAYGHLSIANRMTAELWPELTAGAAAYLEDLKQRKEFFTCSSPRDWPQMPPEERTSPVFLVGFPRSGTTLLDTMLDAHPGVAVLEEEPPLENLANRVRSRPGGYPGALPTLSAKEIIDLRAEYWRDVDALTGEAHEDTLIIDKNPLYSGHAGFICRLFPKARFIFALRHPCDVVLSCFMQAFGKNPAMENFRDLVTAAKTYALIMDLWLLYHEAYDIPVHVLRYEGLVADKDKEIRALLGFLGLPWEDAMLDHTLHAKKRGRIYTPSYHQVIQPIYSNAIARWHGYKEYFGPALEILRPYAERFGYSL